MSRSKVLIFIDWYLPAFKAGGPVKSVASIVRQFENELDLFIITSDRDFGDVQPFKDVQLNQWTFTEGARVIYLSPDKQTADEYSKRIAEIRPQKIYFNSLFSKNFTLTPLQVVRREFPDIQTIVAPRGMLGAGALQIKSLKKKIFLKTANILGWFKKVIWHASTQHEAEEIKLHFGKNANVKIAENLGQVPKQTYRNGKKEDGKLHLIFVSRISTKKNLLFALEILNDQKIKEKVSLTVVGPVENEDYGAQCQKYVQQNKLEVTFIGGKSPLELAELYASHDVFVLPTHHENYGHVIIEALGNGTPVLISEFTPWRKLDQHQIGFDLPLNLEIFRSKIQTFLDMSDDEWKKMSQNAWMYAKEKVNSEASVNANRNLFVN